MDLKAILLMEDGQTEYAFLYRVSLRRKKNVGRNVSPLIKSKGVPYEEWFEMALIELEHDVLTAFLSSNSEEQTTWKWDATLCRLLRSDVE